MPARSTRHRLQGPELLARFWAAALDNVLEPPPEGSLPGRLARDIGLPDSELGIGADSIIDPAVTAPAISGFHVMPDAKVVKNRLHPSTSTSAASPAVRTAHHPHAASRRRGQAADGISGLTLTVVIERRRRSITTRWG